MVRCNFPDLLTRLHKVVISFRALKKIHATVLCDNDVKRQKRIDMVALAPNHLYCFEKMPLTLSVCHSHHHHCSILVIA